MERSIGRLDRGSWRSAESSAVAQRGRPGSPRGTNWQPSTSLTLRGLSGMEVSQVKQNSWRPATAAAFIWLPVFRHRAWHFHPSVRGHTDFRSGTPHESRWKPSRANLRPFLAFRSSRSSALASPTGDSINEHSTSAGDPVRQGNTSRPQTRATQPRRAHLCWLPAAGGNPTTRAATLSDGGPLSPNVGTSATPHHSPPLGRKSSRTFSPRSHRP